MKNQSSLFQNHYRMPLHPVAQTGSNSDLFLPVNNDGILDFEIGFLFLIDRCFSFMLVIFPDWNAIIKLIMAPFLVLGQPQAHLQCGLYN